MAGRLAKADPSLQILIVESGINNRDDPLVRTPAMFLFHLKPDSKTALFHISKPSSHVNGRANVVNSGGLLGGGSSINFMMYTRASASDYDDWNTDGWTFNELKPLLKKVCNAECNAERRLRLITFNQTKILMAMMDPCMCPMVVRRINWRTIISKPQVLMQDLNPSSTSMIFILSIKSADGQNGSIHIPE